MPRTTGHGGERIGDDPGGPVTILVDAPRWEWHGHRWAHAVSDRDLEELHAFARRVGLRYLSFGLDHYDIPEFALPTAIEMGAEPVPSRELARRLVRSGLRRRVGHGARRWHLGAAGDGPVDRVALAAHAPDAAVGELGAIGEGLDAGLSVEEGGEWRILHRPGEMVAMLQWDPERLAEVRHGVVEATVAATASGAVDRVVSARDQRGATVELVVVA